MNTMDKILIHIEKNGSFKTNGPHIFLDSLHSAGSKGYLKMFITPEKLGGGLLWELTEIGKDHLKSLKDLKKK